MAWQPPETEAAFADVWRRWPKAIEDGSEFHFTARDKDDDRFLGVIGMHAALTDTPELGIWLRSEAHGLGLGRELIGAIIGWASASFSIRYFEYPIAEENIASRRIAGPMAAR